MLLRPVIPTEEIWAAFLTLSQNEQAVFLAHAAGYHAAAGALASVRVPDPAGEDELSGSTVRVPPRTPLGSLDHAPAAAECSSENAGTREAVASSSDGPCLPLLGGHTLDLAPRQAFRSPAFTKRFRPGRVVWVYVAGCPGLKAVMRPLDLHAYGVGVDAGVDARKIGIARDASARMAKLGRTRHGSVCKESLAVPDPGFDAWRAEMLTVGGLDPSPDSPVRVCGNAIEVVLPDGATATSFDQALTRALAGASLAGWAMSQAGHAFCRDRGVAPERLVRGTPGTGARVSWSTEIVLVRPRHDTVRLVRLCEDIVLEMSAALHPGP